MRRFALSVVGACAPFASALPPLDNFDDGDLAGWSVIGGAWNAAGGTANQATDTVPFFNDPPHVLQWNGSSTIGSFSLQADVGITQVSQPGNDGVGLVFGFQDPDNFDAVVFFPEFTPVPGALQVRRRINGVDQILVSDQNIGFVPQEGQLYTLRIDLNVDTNRVRIRMANGTGGSGFNFDACFTVPGIAPGAIGLHSPGSQGQFDNVEFESHPCTADWNGDELLNTSDFLAYLNDFVAAMNSLPTTFGDPDLACPSEVLNTSDFIAFLNAYNGGC